jgi:hypothetical protein
VVGVEEDVGDDGPGLIPSEVFVVDKDAHQLGDGKGRVILDVRSVRLASR